MGEPCLILMHIWGSVCFFNSTTLLVLKYLKVQFDLGERD